MTFIFFVLTAVLPKFLLLAIVFSPFKEVNYNKYCVYYYCYYVYNYIQEQTEDTDIYKTLEKYGCLDTLELSNEMIFGDFEKAMDLRDIYEQDIAFKNLWNSLPLKVREQFHNNRLEFMKNGEEWLKNEIQKEKANEQTQPTANVEGETK